MVTLNEKLFLNFFTFIHVVVWIQLSVIFSGIVPVSVHHFLGDVVPVDVDLCGLVSLRLYLCLRRLQRNFVSWSILLLIRLFSVRAFVFIEFKLYILSQFGFIHAVRRLLLRWWDLLLAAGYLDIAV